MQELYIVVIQIHHIHEPYFIVVLGLFLVVCLCVFCFVCVSVFIRLSSISFPT